MGNREDDGKKKGRDSESCQPDGEAAAWGVETKVTKPYKRVYMKRYGLI